MKLYEHSLRIKLSEQQKNMVSVLTDILNEDRSHIVRRLLVAEGKRASAFLDGEELDLWLDLINSIEQENELQDLIRGEAISDGRARAYKERTGEEITYLDKRTLDRHAEKNYEAVKRWRAKKKLLLLKKDGWFNERKIQE